MKQQVEPKNGREYSLFGPKYKTVDPIDHQLQGCVYYLVSGHGGPDPGAIGLWGKHRLCEDEYAYDAMLRLGRNLLQHGAKVYIIVRDPNDGIRDERFLKCDQDEYYYGNVRISASRVARLNKRASIINSLYARNKGSARLQNVIILHVDSRSNNKRIDIFYYYKKRSRAGKSLAKLLYQTVKDKYAEVQPGRGYRGSVTTRDLHMLRKIKPTTVYIELGNIRNRRDQDRFIQQNNRQAVANWLYLGLLKASKK
ncbi:MAG: N-acetylmuramoyl-L-alanine amidase [Calditrichaeota bacterium]|nr:N-acetylmuramoyl-L-alanine amidase [Calditrichota bacterium]